MHSAIFPPSSEALTHYEAQALVLEDSRSHPQEAALIQLGRSLMTETLDLIADTALEDFSGLICEALIGAFHSAAHRIERDADKARDALGGLLRDFDGSEVLDVEIQEATRRARAADVVAMAVELIRDSAAATYTTTTGEVWSPWRGSVRPSRITAAQIDAREAVRAHKARKHAAVHPGAAVVAFRAAPHADTADDANRIFDALNWALGQWPDMTLATSGAKGGEKLAIKWARQKGVTLVLAKADFDRNGRAAPFRANDDLLELEPVCIFTLANSLDPQRAENHRAFGPALNLAQKAAERSLRHLPIRAKG
jgi:hypothetical protein